MWIWIAIATAAAIGEVMTTGLFFASVAFAALAAAAVTFALGPLPQVAVFAALSLVGILLVRPTLIGLLGIETLAQPVGRVSETRLVGRRAVVTRDVDAHGGQIRIGEGEFWSARADDAGDTLAPGTQVEIAYVDGITALVIPVGPREPLVVTSSSALSEGE